MSYGYELVILNFNNFIGKLTLDKAIKLEGRVVVRIGCMFVTGGVGDLKQVTLDFLLIQNSLEEIRLLYILFQFLQEYGCYLKVHLDRFNISNFTTSSYVIFL